MGPKLLLSQMFNLADYMLATMTDMFALGWDMERCESGVRGCLRERRSWWGSVLRG